MLIPTSDRTQDDMRKNAAALANISVDSTQVTTDLSGAKTAVRQGLKSAREVHDQPLQLLPLIPFVPKRAVKQGSDVIFGFPTSRSPVPISAT
jgi:hypothetical protein